MWHNARKSKDLQRQIALLEMEKITKANPGLMASAKEPENAAEIEKEMQAMKRRNIAAKKRGGAKIKSARAQMDSRLKNLAKAVDMTGPKDEKNDEVESSQPPESDDGKIESISSVPESSSIDFGPKLPAVYQGGLMYKPDVGRTPETTDKKHESIASSEGKGSSADFGPRLPDGYAGGKTTEPGTKEDEKAEFCSPIKHTISTERSKPLPTTRGKHYGEVVTQLDAEGNEKFSLNLNAIAGARQSDCSHPLTMSFEAKPDGRKKYPEVYKKKPSENTASVNAGDYMLYVGGYGINAEFLSLTSEAVKASENSKSNSCGIGAGYQDMHRQLLGASIKNSWTGQAVPTPVWATEELPNGKEILRKLGLVESMALAGCPDARD